MEQIIAFLDNNHFRFEKIGGEMHCCIKDIQTYWDLSDHKMAVILSIVSDEFIYTKPSSNLKYLHLKGMFQIFTMSQTIKKQKNCNCNCKSK